MAQLEQIYVPEARLSRPPPPSAAPPLAEAPHISGAGAAEAGRGCWAGLLGAAGPYAGRAGPRVVPVGLGLDFRGIPWDPTLRAAAIAANAASVEAAQGGLPDQDQGQDQAGADGVRSIGSGEAASIGAPAPLPPVSRDLLSTLRSIGAELKGAVKQKQPRKKAGKKGTAQAVRQGRASVARRQAGSMQKGKTEAEKRKSVLGIILYGWYTLVSWCSQLANCPAQAAAAVLMFTALTKR
jgi:hypothetical protein